MNIRFAQMHDLDEILRVYHSAKRYMDQNGNPNQWVDGYPLPEMLMEDIRNKDLFVIEDNETVCGVFCFIIGEDATYKIIQDGKWLNDLPYGTIHRLASDGTHRGVFNICISYCENQIDNLRIDTHTDNKIMQKLIIGAGFERCGIIFEPDGSPRIAYQRKKQIYT